MASKDRVQLLDAKLELTRHLVPDERAELSAITLPTIDVGPGLLELDGLLATHNAFAATVVEGMVVQALQIGEQAGVQLLGPGDLLVEGGAASPTWLDRLEFRLPGQTRLALLDDGFIGVARRAPRLISALYECLADQMQRVTGQLVICQLPRVDQRVLAIMWLLAESWGQVTPGGVRLPLALTHETLGAMVGARRPTVTLALRKLTQQGSIVHQDSGWLLLEPPPDAGPSPRTIAPELAGHLGVALGEAAAAGAGPQRPVRGPQGNGPPPSRAAPREPPADARSVAPDPDLSSAYGRDAPADHSGGAAEAACSIIMITPETAPSPVLPRGSNVTRHMNGFPRRLVACTTTSSRWDLPVSVSLIC